MPGKKKETVTSEYGLRYREDPEFRQRCLDRLNQKVTCEVCGKTVSKANQYRHRKSQRHVKAVAAQELKEETAEKNIVQKLDALQQKIADLETALMESKTIKDNQSLTYEDIYGVVHAINQ